MYFDVMDAAEEAIRLGASDIYLTAGQRMFYRIEGNMRAQTQSACSVEDIRACLRTMLAKEQQERLERKRDVDFSWEIHGRRFRGNAYFQQGKPAIVLRLLSDRLFSFEEIGAKKALEELLAAESGLVLVTGKVGSGKSTTIAAYLEAVNQGRFAHIITLEDPLEYVHVPKNCFISQRELGVDFPGFPQGLRSALREMPDLILVGELRDAETMQTALTAAETGILVLGTMHTRSAAETAMRVVGMFSPGQRDAVREQFASVVAGIVSQQLLPAKNGGRVCLAEVLLATTAARNIIRQGKYPQLVSVMMSGRDRGMQTRQMALEDLYQRGSITKEILKRYGEREGG